MTTRAELQNVLQAWVQHEMPPMEVWRWAETAKEAGVSSDELVRDIIDTLVGLPFDLIIAEDAKVMLDALGNPVEETDLSINLLWNHIDGIHTDARRYDLRDDEFYGQFCDGMD